jgi:predicted nucleic acid-binding protein
VASPVTVADTGAIHALLDRSDRWHGPVVAWWRAEPRTVLLPAPTLPEVCYLLQRRIGPEAECTFVEPVATGEFSMEPLEAEDVLRAAELMRAYLDVPLGFVDATVVAQAERLGTDAVLATDRRHFGLVRPRRVEAFHRAP